MGIDPANTSPPIDANILELWPRCVIILREPLVILSSAFFPQHTQGMLGCAGLLPQLFVGRHSLHLLSFNGSAIHNVPRILEELR